MNNLMHMRCEFHAYEVAFWDDFMQYCANVSAYFGIFWMKCGSNVRSNAGVLVGCGWVGRGGAAAKFMTVG